MSIECYNYGCKFNSKGFCIFKDIILDSVGTCMTKDQGVKKWKQ